jgi:uncharacterized repeat protein (TIGR01451 family)
MKFLPNVRIAGLTTASLLIAAVALMSNAQVTSAARPFNVTETPLPAPTSTRPPVVPTTSPTVPTATPVPNNSSPSQQINTVDPYVTLAGCATCLRNGEETEFTATVGNNGNTQAVNVQLYQKLPPYFQLVDVTTTRGTVIKNADEYIVDIGNLDPKEIITVKVRLRYTGDATAGQPVLNAVIVRTTSQGDLESNNAAVATCQVCEVVLPVTGAESVPTPTLPGLMLLLGSALSTLGALLRRKNRA